MTWRVAVVSARLAQFVVTASVHIIANRAGLISWVAQKSTQPQIHVTIFPARSTGVHLAISALLGGLIAGVAHWLSALNLTIANPSLTVAPFATSPH